MSMEVAVSVERLYNHGVDRRFRGLLSGPLTEPAPTGTLQCQRLSS